jgi:hypothetical protein
MAGETWTWTLREESFEIPLELPLSVTFAFGRFGRALSGDDRAQMSGLADLEDATRGLFGDDFVRFMALEPSQAELLELFVEAAKRGTDTDPGNLSASSISSTGDADR